MMPGVDGFSWSAGHLIFLCLFFAVALVIAATMTFALVRAVQDFRQRRAGAILWKADFDDLPGRARTCRHEFTGEVKHRTCGNGFECGKCAAHDAFLKVRASSTCPTEVQRAAEAGVYGFDMPADRMYHRGHTWVRPEPDGTLVVGLDDFGSRLLGGSGVMELPEEGTVLHVNDTACRVRAGRSAVRILSPVDGEVVVAGAADAGGLFRVKPTPGTDTRHLLQGEEVRPWMLREIERLELALAAEGAGLSLADGGEVVRDLPAACPEADWNDVWSEMFLEP